MPQKQPPASTTVSLVFADVGTLGGFGKVEAALNVRAAKGIRRSDRSRILFLVL
jgi:hypothetical protein